MNQSSTELQASEKFDATQEPERLHGAAVSGGEVHSLDSIRAKSTVVPQDSGDAGDATEEDPAALLVGRLERLERSNRLLRYILLALVLFVGYIAMDKLFPEGVIVQKTILESKELKLLDSDGNARLFLRMYSRVPVLQIVDSNGKPRLSLGLRFDDTPFIDLSDRRGNTRATLEMNEDDAAALRMFDKNGDVSFKIN